MRNYFLSIYRLIFGRRIFYKFNHFIFQCSLRGLGILNYENSKISGEDKFLREFLRGKSSPVVFDVGANEGSYSRKIIEANKSSLIYAFEPHPTTYQRLVANISSPGFQAINAAVDYQEGELNLYDYLASDGSSHASLYKEVIEVFHKSESIAHKVRILNLDEFVKTNSLEVIELLKIDTEGNELNVLNGFRKHIISGKINAIHFEFNEMNVASRVFFRDFWLLLQDYHLYRLLPDGLIRIHEYNPLLCELYAYQNIIALRIIKN